MQYHFCSAVLFTMSDQENDIICYDCEKVETDARLVIECMNCCRSIHFRCRKMFGNAVKKARRKDFVCSIECADIFSRVGSGRGSDDEIIYQLRCLAESIKQSQVEAIQLKSAIDQTRMQVVGLLEKSNLVESSQRFMSNRFESLQGDFQAFKVVFDGFRDESVDAQSVLSKRCEVQAALAAKVGHLESELHRMRLASVSKNVVVLGLPMINEENTRELVLKLSVTVGCNFDKNAITHARRLFEKSKGRIPPIIVTFSNYSAKKEFLQRQRELKAAALTEAFSGKDNRITIRDELTLSTRKLLRETISLKSVLNVKYV